jgi:hypothetical protein
MVKVSKLSLWRWLITDIKCVTRLPVTTRACGLEDGTAITYIYYLTLISPPKLRTQKDAYFANGNKASLRELRVNNWEDVTIRIWRVHVLGWSEKIIRKRFTEWAKVAIDLS